MSAGSLLPDPPAGLGPGIHAATVSRLDPFAVTLDKLDTTYEYAATWVAAGQVPARGDQVLAIIDDASPPKVWAFPSTPGAAGPPGPTGPPGSATPPTVTALPGFPTVDDEIALQTAAMAALTPPVKWRLCYDGTGWEYVGGPALFDEVTASEGTSSGTYVALATPGPFIEVPAAGVYEVWAGHSGNTGGANYGFMSFDIGATAAVDATACEMSDVVTDYSDFSRCLGRLTLPASTLEAKYRARGNGSTNLWARRWMRVLPVRLG